MNLTRFLGWTDHLKRISKRERRLSNITRSCEPHLSIHEQAEYDYETGLQFYGIGAPQFAIRYFLKAHRLKPDWAKPIFHLGVAYTDQGEWNRVWEFLDRLAAIDEDLARVLRRYILSSRSCEARLERVQVVAAKADSKRRRRL